MNPIALFAAQAVAAIVNAITDATTREQAVEAIIAALKPSPPAGVAQSYADHKAEATGQK